MKPSERIFEIMNEQYVQGMRYENIETAKLEATIIYLDEQESK